jgi:type III restriction enzyme
MYLTEDEGSDSKDKFSLILKNHEKNKEKYPEIKKPLTIFITAKIDLAKQTAEEFRKYLIKKGIDSQKAEDIILVVSSKAEHKENVSKLDKVDSEECPVEFIFSVSMLSEGWDVKNVFQIVPHEKRAFESKLLISQVLGRGLRIPLIYENKENKKPIIVTVTNHQKWSSDVAALVDAVAEINRLPSYSVRNKPDYNFKIYWLNQKKDIIEKRKPAEKGSIALPKKLGFKHQIAEKRAKYHEVKEGKEEAVDYKVELNFQYSGDVATQIMVKLQDYDRKNNTNFSTKITIDEIKELIKIELKKINESPDADVSDENRQRALQSFNVLFRKVAGTNLVSIKFEEPDEKDTYNIPTTYVSTRALSNPGRGILLDKKSLELSGKQDKEKIIKFNQDPNRIHGAVISVSDDEEYKCPFNIVHINYNNEREFVKRLIEKENAKNFDAWVKMPDQAFYTIDYSYKPGSHSLTRKFSPDFFIKKGKDIIVVEIKSPGDTKDQNVAKNRAAKKYFEELNIKLKGKQTYHFTFLSENDYTPFFKALAVKKFKMPKTTLQADLEIKED